MNISTHALTASGEAWTSSSLGAGGAADLQELSTSFAKATDDYARDSDEASLRRLRAVRLQIVETLLALKNLEPALTPAISSITVSCLNSQLRSHPRTALEEELFHRSLAAIESVPRGEGIALWFAAMLMAWHAFELPPPPPLAVVPQEIRASWLTFLLETPHAFVHPGDANRFVSYLQRVCELLSQYLRSTIGSVEDVAAVFFRSAAFMQTYFNELNLRELMTARAAIIEDLLARDGSTLDQFRLLRPCRNRPRLGFIVFSASDGTETTALAANLERLDRRRFEIRLYSFLEPSGIMGALCRAAAESYRKLSGNVIESVSRLRREELDIAIFCSNIAAIPNHLTQIAAHRVAPVQATTLASGVTSGLRNMDIAISSVLNEAENPAAHYTERVVYASGALGCYPFHYIFEKQVRPDSVSRAAYKIPNDSVLFFSAANFYKILPELSELWLQILSQVPNSRLMLMPFNPNWCSSYPLVAFNSRLQAQASKIGIAPDRVHIHPTVPTIPHLHRVMEMADIYLDAIPFSGACSLSDALTVGIPIVTRDGSVFRSRQSKAMLAEVGLGDWASADKEDYLKRAIELASDSALRARERERLAQIRRAGLKVVDTAPYAAMMMSVYDGIVADWNKRVETLRATDSDAMARGISVLASERTKRGGLFTDRDLVSQVVLPYLRNGGTRRLIDIGAFVGDISKPFLSEGWQAVMFEPDERCQQKLAALVQAYPGQIRIEKAAVTPDHEGVIQFHLAGAPGLSGLSPCPFVGGGQTLDVRSVAIAHYVSAKGLFDADFINIDAEGHEFAILNAIDLKAMTPRLIMIGFDQAFADQDRASVERNLASMRARGYRACIVPLRAFGRFKRYELPKSLLTIGIDAIPQLPEGFPLFGNILFFREHDHDFLPSFYDWLEQPLDWEQRRRGQHSQTEPAP